MRFRCAAAIGAALGLAALGLAAPAALAGTEEFSNFRVLNQERDDESLLDHLLTRPPRAWNDEWRRAPLAFRTSQGCLTSGQWFIDTDLKLRAALGSRTWLGVQLRQSESDRDSYDYLDLLLRVPTAAGTWGAMFRPLHDKARQDFALSWAAGNDTAGAAIEATFTFEDVFNNFWAFRQTQVGGLGEPYSKRPYEPALRAAWRGERVRAGLAGKWLTPSRMRVVDLWSATELLDRERWGASAEAAVEVEIGGLTFEARGAGQQAREHDLPRAPSATAARSFRRQWSAELSARRALPLARGGTIEARWLYQGRTEVAGSPLAPSVFRADDRVLQLDATLAVAPRLAARAGGMFDRIGVDARALPPDAYTFGTRTESRAYVGLVARFGRVSVQAIEGIELDPEPYEVWLVHDKGFLQLQTTF